MKEGVEGPEWFVDGGVTVSVPGVCQVIFNRALVHAFPAVGKTNNRVFIS